MLNNFRQRLSVYRNSRAPVASFLDFALWTLRTGLPPWKLKFWLVSGLLCVGILVSILWSALMIPALLLTILFGGLVLLMLVLSYVRTMMSSSYSLLEQSNEQIAGRVSRLNGAGSTFISNGSHLNALPSLSDDALVATVISEIMESKFFEVFAQGHDDLQMEVIQLREKLAFLDEQLVEVSEIRAELSSLTRRTERQLRLGSNTISYLSSHVESLEGEISAKLTKTTKRRSTRQTSA